MTKKYQFLQIFTVITLGITAILAIFLGIQAINKSLNLNLAFNSNPIIYCEISIKGENESKFTPIFNNSATSPKIGEGVQLSGNTLTLNNDYCNSFGSSFFMKIQNLTSDSAIYITHSGGALSYSESTITNIPLSYEETSVEMKVCLVCDLCHISSKNPFIVISEASSREETKPPMNNICKKTKSVLSFLKGR